MVLSATQNIFIRDISHYQVCQLSFICLIFGWISHPASKQDEAGKFILDEEEEWLVASELRWHAQHHDDHASGGCSLRPLLIDLNECLLHNS